MRPRRSIAASVMSVCRSSSRARLGMSAKAATASSLTPVLVQPERGQPLQRAELCQARPANRNPADRKLPQGPQGRQVPESFVGDAETPGQVHFFQRQARELRQAGVGDRRILDREAAQGRELPDDGQALVVDRVSAQPQDFEPLAVPPSCRRPGLPTCEQPRRSIARSRAMAPSCAQPLVRDTDLQQAQVCQGGKPLQAFEPLVGHAPAAADG